MCSLICICFGKFDYKVQAVPIESFPTETDISQTPPRTFPMTFSCLKTLHASPFCIQGYKLKLTSAPVCSFFSLFNDYSLHRSGLSARLFRKIKTYLCSSGNLQSKAHKPNPCVLQRGEKEKGDLMPDTLFGSSIRVILYFAK